MRKQKTRSKMVISLFVCQLIVKKNYCLRVCLLYDSLFRSVTTLGQMVLLLRISSWEMIRLVFNGMQGSKRNSFQWSTRQKRIVSVSRVQGRKKIVFSAVQGKKRKLSVNLVTTVVEFLSCSGNHHHHCCCHLLHHLL